jgi:1-acyl-sn-glycerol-3-phosphate acyltransferase
METAVIEARKNRWVDGWFRSYARRYLRRAFHRVLIAGEPPRLVDGPLLVCVNHSSWWDLLLGFWLSSQVLGWDSYAPMDQRQLERYPVLRRLGVFGIDRESLRGGREFLQYARRLMQGAPRALWITAQGAMASNDVRPLRLYSGIARLAESLPGCRVATVVLDYEFWDERLPEAFVSFGRVLSVGPRGAGALLRELEETMEREMDGLDAVRRRRDSSLFREVLRGAGGISPAYDALRRLRAWSDGKAFEPAHGVLETPPRYGPARRPPQ